MSWTKITATDSTTWPPANKPIVIKIKKSPGEVEFVAGECRAIKLGANLNDSSQTWEINPIVLLDFRTAERYHLLHAIAWHPIPPLDGE